MSGRLRTEFWPRPPGPLHPGLVFPANIHSHSILPLAVHINQNNDCNDIESTSGVDLRVTMISEKLKGVYVVLCCADCFLFSAANQPLLFVPNKPHPRSGYTTAFVGKWHGGARSPANLPINRGFDSHFGFLKGS